MRFLADENFPRIALIALREFGFDVTAIAETHPGIPDTEVIAIASKEGRTLLTLDKDFGELAFRRGLPALDGIILFRTASLGPREVADLVLATLQSGAPWAGHFCVVKDRKIRMNVLPPYPPK